jgi:ribosome biogenesis GTPase / thiamine phosphate phosphatase
MSGSALDSKSLAVFHDRIKGKTVMEAGHSGVGKSSILNTLYPEAQARVNTISVQHSTGKHTTTFAEMHIMPDGTRFIDTPGIRDFGVVEVPLNEVGQYFPEFRRHMQNCKFNDCKHLNEPECAIKLALENGDIAQERYYSYLSIMHGEDVFE